MAAVRNAVAFGLWGDEAARVVGGALLGLALFLSAIGCDAGPVRFEPNWVFARNQGLAETPTDFEAPDVRQKLADIEQAVTMLFGTPDEPTLPACENLELGSLLDLALLRMAAGPHDQMPSGQTRGLYRAYCIRCHGVSGSGTGAMARDLNPYPRDFRRGIFKYKNTPDTNPPKDGDLLHVLERGVPGTAMRSFQELTGEQRRALVQYVRYLSVRGLFERELIAVTAVELAEEDRLLDVRLAEIDPETFAEQRAMLTSIAEGVMQPWFEAEKVTMDVPPPPPGYDAAEGIARGRELYFTTLTNCAKCHGATALGDGQLEEYDEWSKELDPTNEQALRDYLQLGALPPRHAQPRNLYEAIYRGGDRPEDLFLKIKHGFAGTTMPSVASQLNDTDAWYLVAYARFLPSDPIGRSASHQ
ncbi:MAG: c-type cytochrome [Planctomycetes bacterium]|nr:c-type cytochrome [Planctomycetota bacterium]